jgi:valyl-tRNA synthetase
VDPSGKSLFSLIPKAGNLIIKGIGKAYKWFANLFKKPIVFTPAQESRLKTIKEIIHNIEVRKSLSGEVLDAGHIEKLKNHRRGLEKAVNALRNSLRNPNMDSRVKEAIEESIKNAEDVLRRINELLK